ncbi:MAG: translation initiation factor IF-2 [candidate division Zixibacteria bacterium HGW-Zixibacteria-1]|nr:MAG: translation initiation factor IF-2 [candidate division Zixibacteria bacterium HGW-Zixibacteria-1]
MAKKRLYEVAKEYKVSSNALLTILQGLGFQPKSHMSVATDEMLAAIRRKFDIEKAAAKKDIEQKKRPKIPPKIEKKPGGATFDERLAKLSSALKKHDKSKKKKFDKRKKSKEARRVDRKAVVKSFRATMASMGTGKRSKKYKKRGKGLDRDFISDENMIEVNEFMTVAELANAMDKKPAEVIATCLKLGMMASINQRLDLDTIETLALEFGFHIKEKEEIGVEAREEEQEGQLESRAPVVTVMGHVDHGKTSLLDYIRKTEVAAQEAGAITQHIGAYEVSGPTNKIVFIDTPGHEAFTAMRACGAQITDIVVLVVAADDAVMPQTVEAIDHARAAGVPIVVAINKIDKPTANPDMIRQQLAKHNLMPEEWGGKNIMVEVSAKTGQGIETLLEMIELQAGLLDLKADPYIRGQGIVVEANLEKGRGPISTIIIQTGHIEVGDPIVAGSYYGHVRVMLNDRDKKLRIAGPATPVRITGLGGVPQAGDSIIVVSDDQEAREIAQKRTQLRREHEIRRGFGRATLDKIYEQIKDGQIKELRLVIKADVDGSAEVLAETLGKIATDEVRTVIIHKGVGAINESDVLLAAASNAIIIGFNVSPDGRARDAASREKVEIKQYSIIYDVEGDIRKALEGMLAPDISEEFVGVAEVRQIFRVPKVGVIAGCIVKEGAIHRTDKVHIVRDGRKVYTGHLSSLKRFKDDVREVTNGYECGIGVENYHDLKVGDAIEVYKLVETARKLI